MKYCVENDLSLFEFHDSVFSYVGFDGMDLVVSVTHMNIRKDTPQNPSDCDMEISTAQITFQNFNAATYEPGRLWKTGKDGKGYPVGPRIVYSGQEAINQILDELKNNFSVFCFEKEDDGKYFLDGCGIEPYFAIEFGFDGVVVCWDEYKEKALYELCRQYRYDMTLQTQNADEIVVLVVVCYEESSSVSVGCTFEGKNYWGYGSDGLWIDAFADLQRRLPKGVLLKCCLTCKHGNLCPVGNDANEVFCTKDVSITQKSDLFFYTEDDSEREKRSRQYCGLCKDHQPQADGFYTYNDYLYYLKKV